MINVCEESKIFTNNVFDSVSKLITNKIWLINPLAYRTWKNYFVTEEEKFFCACLLDSLLYRSNDQLFSCFHSIFNQKIPSMLFENPNDFTVKSDVVGMLRKKQNAVKLITIDSNGAIGKSSHILANHLIKHFDILPDNIISPWDIKSLYDEGTSMFIFIDDFLGSGDQFTKQLDSTIRKKYERGVVSYCPIIAHETGIDFVNSQYPNVLIEPVEIIKKDYCFFKKYFTNNGNSETEAKMFYEDFLKKIGFNDGFYGYEDLGVSVAFEHSSPDNCLLVLNGKNGTLANGIYNKLFN